MHSLISFSNNYSQETRDKLLVYKGYMMITKRNLYLFVLQVVKEGFINVFPTM